MPTYVYECSYCGKQFEAQQRITEDPLTTCICGSEGTIKRVIQPIAVVFKGSGFHINDYSSSTSTPAKPAESATPSEPAPAAATESAPAATESKPDAPAAASAPSTDSK